MVMFTVLAACGGGNAGSAIDEFAALQLANETREGCVASNLDIMLGLVDRLAPLAEATDLDGLAAAAANSGCTLSTSGITHFILCRDIDVRGEIVTMAATLELLGADGFPVATPAEAASVHIIIETDGTESQSEGEFFCRVDLDEGIIIDGWLDTLFADGCQVETSLDGLIARIVADFPGIDSGIRFIGGSADLRVMDSFGEEFASGTAALVGRAALVALEVAGFFSHGEINLDF